MWPGQNALWEHEQEHSLFRDQRSSSIDLWTRRLSVPGSAGSVDRVVADFEHEISPVRDESAPADCRLPPVRVRDTGLDKSRW